MAPSDDLRAELTNVGTRKECPKCHGIVFTGVQYRGTSQDYDGVSEWVCHGCETRFGRWTRRELIAGDLERRYGG